MLLITYLISLLLPQLTVKPTHYVVMDMTDLDLTAKQYMKYLEDGEINHPSSWTPCIRLFGKFVSVSNK